MSSRPLSHLGPAHSLRQVAQNRRSTIAATSFEEDPSTMHLLERMAELEIEQRDTRTQLLQLAEDKQQFESSLEQLRAETSAIKQIKTEQTTLKARLVDAIEAKEQEHEQLREQIEHSQQKAEHGITQLRIERDQAFALTKIISDKNPVKLSDSSFRMRLLLISTSLLSILLISLLIF